jgi:cold shock CspA family protein
MTGSFSGSGVVSHVDCVDRGFAFIEADDSLTRIFVHARQFSGDWPPARGQRVDFVALPSHDGRAPQALACKPL